MQWLDFIAAMTGSLVWPVMAVVVVLVFRVPIAKRIETLRSASAGPSGFAAEFGDVEPQVEDALDAEANRAQEQGRTSERTASGEYLQQDHPLSLAHAFMQLALQAEDNPSYAVLASWSLLESVMRNALEMVWIDPRNRNRPFQRSGVAVISELQRLELITPELVTALHGLRRLRNDVAHAALKPEVGAATAYVDNTSILADVIWESALAIRGRRIYDDDTGSTD